MLEQILSIKQKQELSLKPKMLQSLQMLALPLLELEMRIKEEIVKNPLLDISSEDESTDYLNEIHEKEEKGLGDEHPDISKQTLHEAQELTEILDTWNDFHKMNSGGRSYANERQESDNGVFYERYASDSEDVMSEYMLQLYSCPMKEDEYQFAKYLIDSVDQYGFLKGENQIYQIAQIYNIDKTRADEIHKKVMSLNPKGLTATSISECLIAQLSEEQLENRTLVGIINEGFDDLIHRRYAKLATKFQVSVDYVLFLKEQVAKLDPKPGLRLTSMPSRYIVPDVIIKDTGEEYEIIINDSFSPNLMINSRYRRLLTNASVDKETVNFVREKINSAKFLIKSMYMRVRTIERVMLSIIKFQKKFFYEQSGILNPLTYSMVAEDVGVSESTISRVVKDKYVDTPMGIYHIKHFFTTQAGVDDNFENISRQQIMSEIQKIIENENKSKPFTDQHITKELKSVGLNVSRRIVAKYRDEMGILNSRLRKN